MQVSWLAKRNFGSGSSREHAVWALTDFDSDVIAPSFADIFYNNSFKNGMLPIVLPEETVEQLFSRTQAGGRTELTIDLGNQVIRGEEGLEIPFEVDSFPATLFTQWPGRYCFVAGA